MPYPADKVIRPLNNWGLYDQYRFGIRFFTIFATLQTLPGLLKNQLQEKPTNKGDVNPPTSDHKALSLPSFTVTQTLVNLLAEKGGMLFLFLCVLYSMRFLYNIQPKQKIMNIKPLQSGPIFIL